jgi:hypothetical protein
VDDRTKEHVGWILKELQADPVNELAARFELIHHWRSEGDDALYYQSLETLSVQLYAARLMLDLAEAIAVKLVDQEPSRFRLRLLAGIAAERGDDARANELLLRVESTPKSEGDVAGEKFSALAADPNWKNLSREEKAARFRSIGLLGERGSKE